jgi:hypothetical protein
MHEDQERSEESRAVKYLSVIRKVRAVVDEWPEVEISGSPMSRIRALVAFAGSATNDKGPQPCDGDPLKDRSKLTSSQEGISSQASRSDGVGTGDHCKAEASASLAKPQPVGGALTDEQVDAALEAWFASVPAGIDHKTDRTRMRAALAATLSAPVAQPGEATAYSEAYDMVDRFLRNNLDDNDYAEYSLALEAVLATPIAAQPAAAEPVADEQIKAALMKYNDWAEGITFAGAIKAFRSLASPAQAAAVPANSEIYAALRQAGLSLVKTVHGLHVVKLIEGEAQYERGYEQGRFDEQAAQGPNPYPDDGAVSQAAAVPEAVSAITWPKARDIGRMGDMTPARQSVLRVGLDADNDVYVNLWDAGRDGGPDQFQNVSIEFCNSVGGGGSSPRTRAALINLMSAIEADNAADSTKAWPYDRAALSQGDVSGEGDGS